MSHDESTSADDVRRLLDIHEITQLKARYCRFVDTHDWEGYASLLTEDFHFESDGGVQTSRDEVVAMVSSALGDATTVHHVHPGEVTFTGPDAAHAVWPMDDYVEIPLADGSFVLHGYGHYHEDYVRTPEGWKLQRGIETRIRVDTSGERPTRPAALTEDGSA